MCAECRVIAMTEENFDPFGAPPPSPRPTEDTCASAHAKDSLGRAKHKRAAASSTRHAARGRALLRHLREKINQRLAVGFEPMRCSGILVPRVRGRPISNSSRSSRASTRYRAWSTLGEFIAGQVAILAAENAREPIGPARLPSSARACDTQRRRGHLSARIVRVSASGSFWPCHHVEPTGSPVAASAGIRRSLPPVRSVWLSPA